MILARTAVRITTAFIGLVAVIFGAFEHEDLVLQGTGLYAGTAEPSTTATATAAAAIPASRSYEATVARTKADSGTEGTFRAESHQRWFPPAASRPAWRQVWTTMPRFNRARFEHRAARRACQGIVGITELRV